MVAGWYMAATPSDSFVLNCNLHNMREDHELCGKQVAFNAEIDGMWSREDYIPTRETRALRLAQKETRLEEDSYRKASHSYMNKPEANAVHVAQRRVSYNWHKSERRGDCTCEVCDQCGEGLV